MEKEVKIKIPKNKKCIYGIQRGSLSKPLVIFVHGLTGHMNEHHFFNGARFFEKNGFSSCRFNLYDGRDQARDLIGCTLQTHADDLDVVIRYLRRKGAKKIYVVGHSFGGVTVLLSKDQNYNAAVLWDPSHGSRYIFQDAKFEKCLNLYRMRWGTDFLIGKRIVNHYQTIKWNKLGTKITKPIKVIVAEKGVLQEGGDQYYDQLAGPKQLVSIKGAGHCFDEDKAEEKLFRETLKWLKKY